MHLSNEKKRKKYKTDLTCIFVHNYNMKNKSRRQQKKPASGGKQKDIRKKTSIMINLWPHVYRKKEQKGECMLVKYLKISTLSMYRDENCLFGDV